MVIKIRERYRIEVRYDMMPNVQEKEVKKNTSSESWFDRVLRVFERLLGVLRLGLLIFCVGMVLYDMWIR